MSTVPNNVTVIFDERVWQRARYFKFESECQPDNVIITVSIDQFVVTFKDATGGKKKKYRKYRKYRKYLSILKTTYFYHSNDKKTEFNIKM